MKKNTIVAALTALAIAAKNVWGSFGKNRIHHFKDADHTYNEPPPQRTRKYISKNDIARAKGIPKWLRQYTARYESAAPMLNSRGKQFCTKHADMSRSFCYR